MIQEFQTDDYRESIESRENISIEKNGDELLFEYDEESLTVSVGDFYREITSRAQESLEVSPGAVTQDSEEYDGAFLFADEELNRILIGVSERGFTVYNNGPVVYRT